MKSAIRRCPKCSWEFPSCFTKTKCRFCSTLFETQWCLRCKKFVPTHHFYVYKTGKNIGCLNRLCKTCGAEVKREWDKMYPEQNVQRVRRFIENKKKIASLKYSEWLDLTKLDFKLLSEDDWLKACAYFDGCAICGNDHIEAREFLVGFQEGGRYTAWNIFPMCGRCAKLARQTANPFIWLDSYLGTAKKLGLTEERKQRLLEYFVLQIERVNNR